MQSPCFFCEQMNCMGSVPVPQGTVSQGTVSQVTVPGVEVKQSDTLDERTLLRLAFWNAAKQVNTEMNKRMTSYIEEKLQRQKEISDEKETNVFWTQGIQQTPDALLGLSINWIKTLVDGITELSDELKEKWFVLAIEYDDNASDTELPEPDQKKYHADDTKYLKKKMTLINERLLKNMDWMARRVVAMCARAQRAIKCCQDPLEKIKRIHARYPRIESITPNNRNALEKSYNEILAIVRKLIEMNLSCAIDEEKTWDATKTETEKSIQKTLGEDFPSITMRCLVENLKDIQQKSDDYQQTMESLQLVRAATEVCSMM